jgi:hypothetical protein
VRFSTRAANGQSALSNGFGLEIANSSYNLIGGRGNVISGNLGSGIAIEEVLPAKRLMLAVCDQVEHQRLHACVPEARHG